MNPQTNMSFVHLILNASWVVQLVMLLLVVGSVLSWAVIFRRSMTLRRTRTLNAEFEEDFWSGASLNDLYNSALKNASSGGPLERMFANGMREFHKLRERQVNDAQTLLAGARRAMLASYNREMDETEEGLPMLGTVGSIAPYIGLFGTVWGVIHAFSGFAGVDQVSLASVAPGISEALAATALGLFTAIPAVIAYNRFSREIDRIGVRMESFAEEFSNILQRNLSATSNNAVANY